GVLGWWQFDVASGLLRGAAYRCRLVARSGCPLLPYRANAPRPPFPLREILAEMRWWAAERWALAWHEMARQVRTRRVKLRGSTARCRKPRIRRPEMRTTMAIALVLAGLPGCSSQKSPPPPPPPPAPAAAPAPSLPSGKIDEGTVTGTATVQRIDHKT